MCNVTDGKACSADLSCPSFVYSSSDLLEFSASDDLSAFVIAVEKEGHPIDELSVWYARRVGSKEMGFEERTPLMVASMFGSKQVVSYILEKGGVDVNKACGSDGATALHCAVAGGSAATDEIVKLLIDASADVNSLDANGKRPLDLIGPVQNSSFNSRRKTLEIMLNGGICINGSAELDDQLIEQTEGRRVPSPVPARDGIEKKEYPVDPSLPDIKNGIYGTDEFRMYTFKVKPCSRAYSHDWTECPFVHPGENARRRDPRKYHYSCVPCPDFRKNTCQRGDACEYAHGIFECWLHPAQYRTRLCKDETSCTRRVCFFAHRLEELRPLYASTGSAVPSPRSYSGASSLDIASISPLALGSPSIMMPSTSTSPMTPAGAPSPMGGSMWPSQSTFAPPTLQLPGSRLKSALNARDIDVDTELFGLDTRNQWRQQRVVVDDLSGISSPSSWNNGSGTAAAFAASSVERNGEGIRHSGLKPTNLDDMFGGLDSSVLSQLQGLSLDAGSSQLLSPTGLQMRQNMQQQLFSTYTSGLPSSPVRTPSPFGNDSSGSAATVLNSRAAAFAKRSQSFIDRSAVNRYSGISSPLPSAAVIPSPLSDWSSPDGKLDWGIQKEELSKLRKSASFGFRNSGSNFATSSASSSMTANTTDASWAPSLVKEGPSMNFGPGDFDNHEHQQYLRNSTGSEILPSWVDQFYMEQEQILA